MARAMSLSGHVMSSPAVARSRSVSAPIKSAGAITTVHSVVMTTQHIKRIFGLPTPDDRGQRLVLIRGDEIDTRGDGRAPARLRRVQAAEVVRREPAETVPVGGRESVEC